MAHPVVDPSAPLKPTTRRDSTGEVGRCRICAGIAGRSGTQTGPIPRGSTPLPMSFGWAVSWQQAGSAPASTERTAPNQEGALAVTFRPCVEPSEPLRLGRKKA